METQDDFFATLFTPLYETLFFFLLVIRNQERKKMSGFGLLAASIIIIVAVMVFKLIELNKTQGFREMVFLTLNWRQEPSASYKEMCRLNEITQEACKELSFNVYRVEIN